MRRLKKSNRVSWASDVNLCQVRFFLSEESPLQVGLSAQDNLQSETSGLLHSTGTDSDDNVPPGFEEASPLNLLKNKWSQIPVIKWRCPPRIVLDFTWQVVAGEGSKEVEVQNAREMRVLEAVFPRPSAIPPNPSLLTGTEEYPYNDEQTPLIPNLPIEEYIAAATSLDSTSVYTSTTVPQYSQLPPGFSPVSQCSTSNSPNHGVEPDIPAAAYATMAAAMTRNGQENVIDRDFLLKILSDKKLMGKLVAEHQEATNSHVMPKPTSPGMNLPDLQSVHSNGTEAAKLSLAAASSAPFYPPTTMAGPVWNPRPPPPEAVAAPPPPGAPVAKDINYYKSLIQQHGGERPEISPQPASHHNQQFVANFDSVNNPKPRDSKPKIMKPCLYFNSSRGCRHGANCSYQHDAVSQQQGNSTVEAQSAKRMKVDREITGP